MFGFFATRWVSAPDAEQAGQMAAEQVADEILRSLPRIETSPELIVEEVEALAELPEDYPTSGATWFPMDRAS